MRRSPFSFVAALAVAGTVVFTAGDAAVAQRDDNRPTDTARSSESNRGTNIDRDSDRRGSNTDDARTYTENRQHDGTFVESTDDELTYRDRDGRLRTMRLDDNTEFTYDGRDADHRDFRPGDRLRIRGNRRDGRIARDVERVNDGRFDRRADDGDRFDSRDRFDNQARFDDRDRFDDRNRFDDQARFDDRDRIDDRDRFDERDRFDDLDRTNNQARFDDRGQVNQNDLRSRADDRQGWLGVLLDGDSDPQQGVRLERVLRNGAADEAGLEAGDTIRSVAGTDVRTAADVLRVLDRYHRGEMVSLDVVQDGRQRRIRIALEPLSGFDSRAIERQLDHTSAYGSADGRRDHEDTRFEHDPVHQDDVFTEERSERDRRER